MDAETISADKHILEVRLDVYSTAEGRETPPSAPTLYLVQTVLDRFVDTPPRAERSRLPELAEHWGCSYVGLEVLGVKPSYTEVHSSPSLAHQIAEVRHITHT